MMKPNNYLYSFTSWFERLVMMRHAVYLYRPALMGKQQGELWLRELGLDHLHFNQLTNLNSFLKVGGPSVHITHSLFEYYQPFFHDGDSLLVRFGEYVFT